ncbi:MAG TPA: neutral/alkaline non-lysosomal ceramidase N-terminal domain-containing protein [Candidatus Limnocylindrales bacterium]|nr:neutral/alkaline non-lysosomal ceramidase N-terminal domain-containing protein [Candidatus Limnocylindrales bacterium]
MMTWRNLTCLLLALLTCSVARTQSLEAGVARVDITPPLGLHLQGYPGSGRTATGVRDPLCARVLVLRVGALQLALVDVDLIAPFEPTYMERLREAVKADVKEILVTAIHTHSGPALIPGSASPAEWEAAAVDKIAEAVHEAASRRVAARLGVGYGLAYIGHNRLRHNHDGSVTWFEKNPNGVPTSPIDPTVAVIRVDDQNGQPLAILVNYACHPVIYGPDNQLYSADFPGVMTRVVDETFGGKTLTFFLQGADGDINPLNAVTPLPEGAVELCERAGSQLGQVAARVAQQIHTVVDATPSLQFQTDRIFFGPRWDGAKWLAADPRNAQAIAAKTKASYELPVTTVLINKRIAILTMPGEPFVDFQMLWRERCPVSDCLFLGYTNGYYGYFPTIGAATWGGYGAAHPSTWIEVGAGERMVDRGIIRIHEMLGELRPVPLDENEAPPSVK